MTPYYDDGKGIVIYHGDSRDVLPKLSKADLVIADPPYGIGESRKKQMTRGKVVGFKSRGRRLGGSYVGPVDYGPNDWDKKPIDVELLRLTCGAGDSLIIFGGNYYHTQLSQNACWLVWDKEQSGDFADCELAWTNLPGSVRRLRWRWNGMLQEVKEKRFHPTQKPVALIKWMIRIADQKTRKAANLIIDPFMGGGTTLRAAKDLERSAIGIEIEERYCEIAARRLQQEVLQLA